MSTFPIILIPGNIDQLWSSKPNPPEKPVMPEKPQQPKKLEMPKLPEKEKSRFHKTGWLGASAVGALVLLGGPLEAAAVSGLGIYAAYDATLGYAKRVEQYKKDLKYYDDVLLPRYEKEQYEYPSKYRRWQKKVAAWDNECQMTMDAYRRECERLLSPKSMEKWRSSLTQDLIQERLEQLDESNARAGKLDLDLYQAVQQLLPELKVARQLSVDNPNYHHPYTPDIIIHDPQTGIYVDVEIDEPWYWNQSEQRKVPNHCRDNFKDAQRNQFFQDKNWFVIRFAESQVSNERDSCVKLIAKVLDAYRTRNFLSRKFENIPHLSEVKHWLEDESLSLERP